MTDQQVRRLFDVMVAGAPPDALDLDRAVAAGRRRRRGRAASIVGSTGVVLLAVFAVVATAQHGNHSSGATTVEAASKVRDSALQLRPVLAVDPGSVAACASLGAAVASPASPTRGCSTDGSMLYTLGPAVVSGAQIKSVAASAGSGGSAEIDVALDSQGTTALATFTQALAADGSPMAICVNGVVASAPTVMEPITTGQVVISGDYTLDTAKKLVDELTRP